MIKFIIIILNNTINQYIVYTLYMHINIKNIFELCKNKYNKLNHECNM